MADIKKRRCTPSPSPKRVTPPQIGNIMAPSGPFLTWSPILLPPWGLYPALYPAALRSALPGLVFEERFENFENLLKFVQ